MKEPATHEENQMQPREDDSNQGTENNTKVWPETKSNEEEVKTNKTEIMEENTNKSLF